MNWGSSYPFQHLYLLVRNPCSHHMGRNQHILHNSFVGFYAIWTIEGYLMPNPLRTHLLNIQDLVWFRFVLWNINHCRLFNAESSLYMYIKYIRFGLVLVLWNIKHSRLFDIKSSLYIYIKCIRIWFSLVWWDINYYRLFNAKSSPYNIYQIYVRFVNTFWW